MQRLIFVLQDKSCKFLKCHFGYFRNENDIIKEKTPVVKMNLGEGVQ